MHPLRAVVLAALVPVTAAAQQPVLPMPDSARVDSAALAADSAVAVGRIAVPPPVLPPWRYTLDLGFQDVRGNRDLIVFNTVFVAEHQLEDQFILNMKLEARYGRSNGVTAVDAQGGRIRFDWRPRNPVSPFLGVDAFRDPIRKSAFRLQVGTGANLNLRRADARRTTLALGVVVDYQEFTSGVTPSTARDARLHMRLGYLRLIGQTARVEFSSKFQPALEDFDDQLATIDALVRFTFSRRMGLSLRYEWISDTRPAPGVGRTDRIFTTGLSFAWGR